MKTILGFIGSPLKNKSNTLTSMLLCATEVKIGGDLGTYAIIPQQFRDREKALEAAPETACEIYHYISGEKKLKLTSI
ncbi:MAG: hypothetical protein BME94_07765 [Methanobacteriales archaeon Met13]